MVSKTDEILLSSKLDTGYTLELKFLKTRKTSILVIYYLWPTNKGSIRRKYSFLLIDIYEYMSQNKI